MGGKQKQAQRVKNNARPSNSGRSAEFLGTASTIPPFNFSTMKEAGFKTASFSLTPVDDIDASVDSNFQLVLKKMNKKDATTKLKALQEFTELVKNAESDAVKAILPFWPRLYCALATDAEHRVREATHVAHNQVVLKAKRNLAPYLKQLAGPWFTSQYDTYAPASSAASRSFKDAFPVNKVQEAILFCQEEILIYICDNLTVHTAHTLSNPKTTTPDESKAKYERVLISSLQGYALYIRQLSEDGIKKAEQLNRKILTNNKFWKLARNEITQIRASWFGALAAICEKACFLLAGEEANVVKSVFGVLDESDPSVQCTLWEAVLLTTNTIENWWTFYNIEEKLLPKLWKILKEAGYGNATRIYPNLLPLISHLPSSLNYEEFLPKFFINLKAGLSHNSARSSQSELRAISVAFIECLQYTIMQNHENVTLCEQLIKEHLIPLIDVTLVDSRASHKTLFNQVSSLVQYWHKNKEKGKPNYSQYLQVFWQELEKLLSIRITEYAAKEKVTVVSDIAGRQIDLLVCLKHTVKPKQFKVQFTTEDEADGQKPGRKNSRTHSILDRSYLDALHRLVYNICVYYIKIVDYDVEKKLPDIIENIVALVQEFESEDFVEHLKAKFCDEKDPALMTLFNLIFNWINNPRLCRKSVLDLTFFLLKYATDTETNETLEQFLTIDNDEALGWAISRALSHPHNARKVVQTWLGNPKIGEFMIKITKYEIKDRTTPDLSLLLKQAFTETNDNDELFISETTVNAVLGLLSSCLQHPTDIKLTIDNCASLAAYIASSVYNDISLLNDELFLALFHLTCNMREGEYEYLSKDTLWEVKTAWQDALVLIVSNLDKEVLIALSCKCGDVFRNAVLDNEITSSELDGIVDIVTKYLLCVEKCKPLIVGEIFNCFIETDSVSKWRKQINTMVMLVEYFKGNACWEHQKTYESVDIEPANILKYFSWKLLVIKILITETNTEDEDSNEDFDENEKEQGANRIVKLLDTPEEVLLVLLQDMVEFDNILTNFTHLKHYDALQDLNKVFTKNFMELFDLNKEMRTLFEEKLKQKIVQSNYESWCTPVYTYFIQMKKEQVSAVYNSLTKNATGQMRMRLTQSFSKNREITFDDAMQRVQTIEGIVRLRCLLHCEEIDVQIAEVFGTIEKLTLGVDAKNWEDMQLIIEIARLYTALMKNNKTSNVSRHYWDFIVINLGNWSTELQKIKCDFTKLQITSFVTAISNLFIAVSDHISLLKCETPPSKYVDEWENVFVRSITSDLVNTWLYVSEELAEMKIRPITLQPFLQEFGHVINYLRPTYVFDSRIEKMPRWSVLLKTCCVLLTTSEHALQLWSHHMLKVLSIGFIQVDEIAVETNTPHEKGLVFEQFKDLLVETHNIVSTMLLEFKLGADSCRVEPFTDSYTYTFAYLLLWDILLHCCEKSSRQLRFQYADWLKNEDLLNSLLSSIFKLMPFEVFQSDSAKSPVGNWFTDKVNLSLQEPITSEKIGRLDCSVYASTLAQLPASVRQWWADAETKTSQIVEQVTTTYVSPLLCNLELEDVTKHENKFRNLIIKVHPTIREVVAIYTVDEAQMELFITLPPNYPLGGPDVDLNRQIGGLPHKQWLMQLRMCVLHQNGRIWDALCIWNNNLDKKFDGVEECYICFAVLHPGTYQLPKVSCKTCRKKFHAACLYKWFSTSNNSTCPICRNLF